MGKREVPKTSLEGWRITTMLRPHPVAVHYRLEKDSGQALLRPRSCRRRSDRRVV